MRNRVDVPFYTQKTNKEKPKKVDEVPNMDEDEFEEKLINIAT